LSPVQPEIRAGIRFAAALVFGPGANHLELFWRLKEAVRPVAEFLSLFTFIFLAALPGRTTFILILLAANGSAARIFTGAALAFLLQSMISVLAGEALSYLPAAAVEIGAGILFLFFARKFWIEGEKPPEALNSRAAHSVRAVFALIFMGELGDVSQLAIAAAASRASSKGLVFLMAVAALWLITALALILGGRLGAVFRPKVLQRVASAAFLACGLYLCLRGALSTLG
jgi:putative Ca2+/H+ antiporter (TMEM165/GDT1 family)